MASYTVVVSDASDHDAGLRSTSAFWAFTSRFGGYAELGLYWFLKASFGGSAVQLMTPSQLLRCSRLTTDVLFVGLPTKVSREHLARIQFRRLVLYDATDCDGITFGYSDREFLLSQTDLCLKNWRDRTWDYDFAVGLLPIKRPPLNKLRLGIYRQALTRRLRGTTEPAKRFDVGYVARPTGDGAENPRIRWLVELRGSRPDLKIWGGLVGGRNWHDWAAQSENREVLESLWLNRRKIGFFEYFAGLCRSKVALAPRGFAPWSYRHYEAIYARSIVVCNDMRNYDLLIPLPTEGIVQVCDGESVVPAVEKALAMYDQSPEIIDANLAFLENWMDSGGYSCRRQDLTERFLAQLQAA